MTEAILTLLAASLSILLYLMRNRKPNHVIQAEKAMKEKQKVDIRLVDKSLEKLNEEAKDTKDRLGKLLIFRRMRKNNSPPHQ